MPLDEVQARHEGGGLDRVSRHAARAVHRRGHRHHPQCPRPGQGSHPLQTHRPARAGHGRGRGHERQPALPRRPAGRRPVLPAAALRDRALRGLHPDADLLEVSHLPAPPSGINSAPIPLKAPAPPDRPRPTADAEATAGFDSPFQPLTPVFNLSGIDPEVASLFAPRFAALGVNIAAAGGSYGEQSAGLNGGPPTLNPEPGTPGPPAAPAMLRPGDAVSVALATGDITIAGTGTVSSVDGDHLLAFGHPLMRLGAVDLPDGRRRGRRHPAEPDEFLQGGQHRPGHRHHQPGPPLGRVRRSRPPACDDPGRGHRAQPRLDPHPAVRGGAAAGTRPADHRRGAGAGHPRFERRRPGRGIPRAPAR